MLCRYDDLRALTDKEPIWFDEQGVPRWCEFHPSKANNPYADEVALLEIECQECRRRYKVAVSWSLAFAMIENAGKAGAATFDQLKANRPSLHPHNLCWGDPPCWECSAGYCMSCFERRVLEFWQRGEGVREWKRLPECEIRLDEEAPDAPSA